MREVSPLIFFHRTPFRPLALQRQIANELQVNVWEEGFQGSWERTPIDTCWKVVPIHKD